MARKSILNIDAGATFTATINAKYTNGQSIDLSSFTARGTLRKHHLSANSVAFTCNTTADGLETGDLVLSLAANVTALLDSAVYVYDVEVEDSGIVYRVQDGIAMVASEVST